MAHQVIQEEYEIRVGCLIVFQDENDFVNVDGEMEQGRRREGRVIGKELGCLRVRLRDQSERLIPMSWYQHTLVVSPDLEKAIGTYRQELLGVGLNNGQIEAYVRLFVMVWQRCEKSYGIDEHGSSPTDTRREIAFKILKGDPMALDFATDVLAT